MSGYVFVSNSTKPTPQKAKSRDKVTFSNVSRPCLQAALDMGYDTVCGTNRDQPEELPRDLPVKLYDSHAYRSITAFGDNRIAYQNLCKVVKENDIDVIHCNTPVGGLVGRLVGKRYHVKHVIYTAHGFHFFKGAPLFNRTVLKWAEQIMAHWTDVIITMNQEDYEAAKKMHLKKNGRVYKVHGVGITLSEYENLSVDREAVRSEFGFSKEDMVCIAAGDLVPRKNYGPAIRAIAEANNAHIHYLVCGVGPEMENLKALAAELKVENQIHFLGFRKDMKQLMLSSDVFFFTSLQEGLPRSLMEAMACGLPAVCSAVRGNVDLIREGEGGFLCAPNDAAAYEKALTALYESPELRRSMAAASLARIQEFDISVVEREIRDIYRETLCE